MSSSFINAYILSIYSVACLLKINKQLFLYKYVQTSKMILNQLPYTGSIIRIKLLEFIILLMTKHHSGLTIDIVNNDSYKNNYYYPLFLYHISLFEMYVSKTRNDFSINPIN